MNGQKMIVRYEWQDDALLATMHDPAGSVANGRPIVIKRWVDGTNTLTAESSCDGVSYTRTYDALD